jgi:hypothetical protein
MLVGLNGPIPISFLDRGRPSVYWYICISYFRPRVNPFFPESARRYPGIEEPCIREYDGFGGESTGRLTGWPGMEELRVINHPVMGPLGPGRRVAFSFEGRKLNGYEGEPIAAALMASGIRVVRRTRLHGKPRGVFCAVGLCTDCMVVVNGVPNTRACVTPLEDGMEIRMQKPEGESP